MTIKRYLTPKQVETAYGIKAGTLANWRNQGRGPMYVKFGRKILYSISALEEWCRGNLVLTVDQDNPTDLPDVEDLSQTPQNQSR